MGYRKWITGFRLCHGRWPKTCSVCKRFAREPHRTVDRKALLCFRTLWRYSEADVAGQSNCFRVHWGPVFSSAQNIVARCGALDADCGISSGLLFRGLPQFARPGANHISNGADDVALSASCGPQPRAEHRRIRFSRRGDLSFGTVRLNPGSEFIRGTYCGDHASRKGPCTVRPERSIGAG